MSQEIIFTTLPNKLTEADGKQWLQISVFVSIRLTSATDTTLNSFDDILKWPEKILNSKYQFKLQTGTVTEGELIKQKIDFELFKNVFHKDIRVKGFMQEDLSLKRINSFPMVHIHNFLVKNYMQTAIENPKEKLTADNFIDDERFGIISRLKLNEEEINRLDNVQRMRPHPGRAGCGCARHQCAVDGGTGPAHGPVCRQWCGQECAAGHDGALYERRCHCGRPDRRARP